MHFQRETKDDDGMPDNLKNVKNSAVQRIQRGYQLSEGAHRFGEGYKQPYSSFTPTFLATPRMYS